MFNHIDWKAFEKLWADFNDFMNTFFEWLMYVLADGPKPGQD